MLFEWVRCGVGRCGSRLEVALELELGRLAAASSDMVDAALLDLGVYCRGSGGRLNGPEVAC